MGWRTKGRSENVLFSGGGLPYEGGNFLGEGSYHSAYYVQYIKSNEASRVLELSKCSSISNQQLE